MTKSDTIDAARLELLLTELRLPGIELTWQKLAEQSDQQGWPAARFLAALAEHEVVDRARRRMERHLAEARLPVGKTLAAFDFDAAASTTFAASSTHSPGMSISKSSRPIILSNWVKPLTCPSRCGLPRDPCEPASRSPRRGSAPRSRTGRPC